MSPRLLSSITLVSGGGEVSSDSDDKKIVGAILNASRGLVLVQAFPLPSFLNWPSGCGGDRRPACAMRTESGPASWGI